MTTPSGPIIALDPRDESEPKEAVLALRPTSLDGKVLGLLSNNKPHSEELLRLVADVIKERYALRNVVEYNKGSHQWPAGLEALKQLARSWDVAIHATAE